MKIVALYDIHGNLPALDAVLQEVEQEQPDLILVGGDVVPGPMPRAALEQLLALGGRIHYIRGNCEREVVAAFDGLPLGQRMFRRGKRADALDREAVGSQPAGFSGATAGTGIIER